MRTVTGSVPLINRLRRRTHHPVMQILHQLPIGLPALEKPALTSTLAPWLRQQPHHFLRARDLFDNAVLRPLEQHEDATRRLECCRPESLMMRLEKRRYSASAAR